MAAMNASEREAFRATVATEPLAIDDDPNEAVIECTACGTTIYEADVTNPDKITILRGTGCLGCKGNWLLMWYIRLSWPDN